MDFGIILAAASKTVATQHRTYVDINQIWQQITSLGLRESLVLIAFGAVCIVYGWRIFKILVVIAAAAVGMIIGMKLGAKFGTQLWGGVLGVIVLAAISLPLMRWAVSVFGAAAGGIITGGLWFAAGLPQEYLWAGALIGVIAGGLMSFIVMKFSVMLFTSLAGTAMALAGVLSLFNLYQPSHQTVTDLVLLHKWFLPVVLALLTIGNIILQNKLIKGSSSWEL